MTEFRQILQRPDTSDRSRVSGPILTGRTLHHPPAPETRRGLYRAGTNSARSITSGDDGHVTGRGRSPTSKGRLCQLSALVVLRRTETGSDADQNAEKRVLAERVGFEPTIRLRVFRFSRPARSTAPSPLRSRAFYQRALKTTAR